MILSFRFYYSPFFGNHEYTSNSFVSVVSSLRVRRESPLDFITNPHIRRLFITPGPSSNIHFSPHLEPLHQQSNVAFLEIV